MKLIRKILDCFDYADYLAKSLEFKLEYHTSKETMIHSLLKEQRLLLQAHSPLEVDWKKFDDLDKFLSEYLDEYTDMFEEYFLEFRDKLYKNSNFVSRKIKKI